MTETYTSFTGHGINVYQAAMLAGSLKLYATAKILPTRGVSAKSLMQLATRILGDQAAGLKARDYLEAARRLENWVKLHKPLAVATGDIS